MGLSAITTTPSRCARVLEPTPDLPRATEAIGPQPSPASAVSCRSTRCLRQPPRPPIGRSAARRCRARRRRPVLARGHLDRYVPSGRRGSTSTALARGSGGTRPVRAGAVPATTVPTTQPWPSSCRPPIAAPGPTRRCAGSFDSDFADPSPPRRRRGRFVEVKPAADGWRVRAAVRGASSPATSTSIGSSAPSTSPSSAAPASSAISPGARLARRRHTPPRGAAPLRARMMGCRANRPTS